MYFRSLFLFLLVTIPAYAGAIALAQRLACFYYVPVHDEVHFMQAIRLFSQGLSLQNLAAYNETSGPLPFILYALWGKVFGLGMPALRTLSMVLGVGALACVHALFFRLLGKGKPVLAASWFVAANPYMMALSVLVYTDMAALFFLFAAVLALESKKNWLYAALMAASLLCRQFMVFFPLAVVLAGLVRLLLAREKDALASVGASLLSMAPLAALMFFVWHGTSPQNAARGAWVQGMSGFHPSFATLYTALLFVYLAPFAILRRKMLFTPWTLGFAAAISLIYFIFPAGPALSGLRYGLVFTGFFHRLLALACGQAWFFHLIFFLCFFLGIPLVLNLVKSMASGLAARRADFAFTLDLSVMAFWAIMPFAYLAWEKYMLPIIPLALVRILMLED